MLKLPEKHPEVQTMLKENGYHSVCHSYRYWAGLWPDFIIEQVMMRSIKSRGGLTRGKDFTESTWLPLVKVAAQLVTTKNYT